MGAPLIFQLRQVPALPFHHTRLQGNRQAVLQDELDLEKVVRVFNLKHINGVPSI